MICEGGGIQLRMEIFHFLSETHTNITAFNNEWKQRSFNFELNICGGLQ